MTTLITGGVVEQLTEVATAVEAVHPRHGRMGSRVTKFSSRKNRSVVTCDSLLEAAFCLELERRNDVVNYEAHPYTLKFIGTNYRYTPDFLVFFTNGSQRLIEVKNDQSFEDKATSARITRYADLLATHGCMLEYLAASHFYQKIRSANLAFLYHQSFPSNGEGTDKLCALLASRQQPTSIGDLLNLGFLPGNIAHAVFYGALDIDLSNAITCSTRVRNKRQHSP
ncbi:Tn7 transposase TnsA N-terminal domain-containing protein [Pseudomonas sp. NPDC077649]|uniref:Tn7 transposase TnsA N-terminal domain-containing protein n=1 Tax=Pseudomonas sp. NPDC077649 TaxID=3364423 RepID=UPI0037C86B5B